MEKTELLDVKQKARQWLDGNFDEDTKKQVRALLENNDKELTDSFYRSLEFGTGGLRGIMGVGTNRMNIYTVGMATQGLCNYLKQQFSDLTSIKVAIAYDCRNNSSLFAKTAAGIFSANDIKVYLFESLRPTPELSYTVRHFGCQSGIVITASHNPKEYNGYKAYWDDGGQVVPPHDENIIQEVNKISDISQVKFSGPEENITIIGNEIDELYTERIKNLSLSPEIIRKNSDIKIVYTPLHGSGVKLVPMVLNKMGFRNIIHVPEQDISDGNFPTVHSPNPEEPAALDMAIRKAKETGADLVMGTDPDADRVGIAVRLHNNEIVLLNGNQTASILIYYLLKRWKETGKLKGKEYIVKTIVTTELLAEMAMDFDVPCYDVLTGFKYIAEIIRQNEGKMTFIGGGEESYGYLAAEFVRDKDAIMSCALIAEAAAWARDQNKLLMDILEEIYIRYGFYKESLLSVTKKGKEGAEEIQRMMDNFRNNPPKVINGSKVRMIHDYLKQISYHLISGIKEPLHQPKSNVLQFVTEDGSKISIRPSGTEPKIKFYFGVKEKLGCIADYDEVNKKLSEKIQNIIKDLNLQ